MAKESHIIVRVEPTLRQRLQRIALLERRNLSDLARIVFEDYVNTQERSMNLVLRDKPSVHSNSTPLVAAQNQIVAAVQRDVSYRKRKRKKAHP